MEQTLHCISYYAPIDGLKIGGYYETGGDKLNNVSQKTGGNIYAQYAFGNIKVGYTMGELEPSKTTDKYATDTADTATAGGDAYESDGLGINLQLMMIYHYRSQAKTLLEFTKQWQL